MRAGRNRKLALSIIARQGVRGQEAVARWRSICGTVGLNRSPGIWSFSTPARRATVGTGGGGKTTDAALRSRSTKRSRLAA